MAIAFFNIRSKETLVAETEPMISALWSSSDHSPNITQGQDFGWRLAPAVVVEMDDIKRNEQKILEIAARYQRLPEDIGETDILTYISDKTARENMAVAQEGDYTDEYNEEIRRMKRVAARKAAAAEAAAEDAAMTTQTTTESLADMRERVELAERLAAAQTATPAIPAPAPGSVEDDGLGAPIAPGTATDRIRRPRSEKSDSTSTTTE